MFSVHPVEFTSFVLAHLATALGPIGGAVAAIVALTLLVRLAVHPLTRAAVRGERARLRLGPKVAALRERHAGDMPRLGRELSALHRGENVSPFAGILPMLVQAPLFLILYAAFRDTHGPLTGAHLFGVPLSAHAFAAAGLAHFAVYGAIFAVLIALAWLASRRAAMLAEVNAAQVSAVQVKALASPPALARSSVPTRTAAPPRSAAVVRTGSAAATNPTVPDLTATMARLGRIMPYALLISAAVLPLAAVIYVVTSTAWSAVENAMLRRGLP